MKLTPGKLISRFAKYGRRLTPALAISFALCLISLGLYFSLYIYPPNDVAILEFLKDIELKTLDVRFVLRRSREPDQRIVIVTIDQKSQDVLGRWPFSRTNFARAVDFLREAGARVIAFDVNFPQPDENSALKSLRELHRRYSGLSHGDRDPKFETQLGTMLQAADTDKEFSAALARAANATPPTDVILGYFFLSKEETAKQDPERVKEFVNYLSFQTYPRVYHPEFGGSFHGLDYPSLSPNLPILSDYAKNFGYFNVIPDPDGTVRRVPVVARFEGNYYPSLDVAASLAFTGLPLDKADIFFNPNGLERVDLGKETIPTDLDGYVQIDYHGRAKTYPYFPISDVVQHKVAPASFKDKLVLIGPTAVGIADFAVTPFQQSEYPGVEVHANQIDNILNGQFIRRGFTEKMIDVLFILLFSLGAGTLLSVVSPTRATAVLVIFLGFFLWLSYDLFANHRIWIAAFLPTATLTTNYAAIVSYRFFFEEREKKKVRGVFQQYLAPSLINQLLENPELLQLGGQEKELTVMFSDIRGFTTLSEGLPPAKLVALLNEYLSEMTDTLFRNWGTLDKYIGDAIMAFWGAPYPQPDHAERACHTALQMITALKKLQAGWTAEGRPRIDIGVGINSGPVLIGNMGSKHRFNYTIMGDNVNLASRLEGLNKEFATHLIISEFTYEQVREKMVARELDYIRVKGKKKPVRIFELLATSETRAQFHDLTARFSKALVEYREGKWDKALGLFGELLKDYPEDGPSAVFQDRCREYLAEPPQGVWDGVYVMETK
jgi:adenylate cyclase